LAHGKRINFIRDSQGTLRREISIINPKKRGEVWYLKSVSLTEELFLEHFQNVKFLTILIEAITIHILYYANTIGGDIRLPLDLEESLNIYLIISKHPYKNEEWFIELIK